MIQISENIRKPVKAVGLISGGLDSTVAAKILIDLGVKITGIYFSMPWGCCDKPRAQRSADLLGIPLLVLQLDERYLDLIKNPRYGYGVAMNPCVDCRGHMFKRAGEYMRSVGADFIFTGEVLGQRPMSQMRHSLRAVEKLAHLEGRIVRPLCAQLLDPTIPELDGLIDRRKLLSLSGRSRKFQRAVAKEMNFTDFPNAAGGCLLTHKEFANRIKDTFRYGYRDFRETIALKWGRHFRINAHFKAIVGRDEGENMTLKSYAHPDDMVLEMFDRPGPVVILKGPDPEASILALAAGLSQAYSRFKNDLPVTLRYRKAINQDDYQFIQAEIPDKEILKEIKI